MCLELLETERNYLNILKAIWTVFAEPLRKLLANDMDPQTATYLDKTEMDTIFGNVPALVDVHEQIYGELADLIETNWKEESQIGKVFLKHVSSETICSPQNHVFDFLSLRVTPC